MTSDILVSIVINNYNYGQFLGAAIRSALHQSYPSTETIVVDDGSTDSSRQVIDSFRGQVVAILKDNGGQASAFNAGFVASRGDVVIFLDSDDELMPDIVERVVAAVQTNPEVAKIMYRMDVIDALGVSTGVVKPAQHLPLRSGDIRRHVYTFPFDLTWMATSGNAFNAQVLRQMLPVQEDTYRNCADWYLSHVSALYGPVMFIEEVGARYRIHGRNNYEVSNFDLKQIRKSIEYMRITSVDIAETVRRLGPATVSIRPENILSVSYVASRLVSLKLDPVHHPVSGDSTWQALKDGAKATSRRFDVGLSMKAMYLLWFALTAAAPRSAARCLAELFFFPETRPRISGLLGLLHSRDEHRRDDILSSIQIRRRGQGAR